MVPKGQGWGHKRGNYFYICILERIFQNENIRLIAIKLGSNISCMIEIQIYSNEGSCPLQRGVITKIGYGHLNIFFKKPLSQNSSKLIARQSNAESS
jgi:hypothetical protein